MEDMFKITLISGKDKDFGSTNKYYNINKFYIDSIQEYLVSIL